MIKDQKKHWNKLHKKRSLDSFGDKETDFAKEVIHYFPKNTKILELGCGVGNDSIFFAKKGFITVATDFSDTVIEKNSQKYLNPNLHFQVLDISDTFPFKNTTFNVIYARLSLHYFTDQKTKKIFKEIYRVLKAGGLICFICKSINDPLYGKGDEIEKDMYINEGHIRHFFTENYVKSLLKDKFEIKIISEEFEDLYGHKSAFIKVITQKK